MVIFSIYAVSRTNIPMLDLHGKNTSDLQFDLGNHWHIKNVYQLPDLLFLFKAIFRNFPYFTAFNRQMHGHTS